MIARNAHCRICGRELPRRTTYVWPCRRCRCQLR